MQVPRRPALARRGASKVSGDWRNTARAAWILAGSFSRLAWHLWRAASRAWRKLRMHWPSAIPGVFNLPASHEALICDCPAAWPNVAVGPLPMGTTGHLMPPAAGAGSLLASHGRRTLASVGPETQALYDAGLLSRSALFGLPGLSTRAAVHAFSLQQTRCDADRHIDGRCGACERI